MKVVILCGGQGTRIRDASELLPKPMLPIGGWPIVWHIMKIYAFHGFSDFVLALGYKSWHIKEFFLNYRAMTSDMVVTLGPQGSVEVVGQHGCEDWRVTLAETGEHTQTAGRVAAIRRYVEGDELFMLTYGDGVSNVDIGALVDFHRQHGRVVTVTAVHPPGRFGEMQTQGSVVTEFNEKPQTTVGFINGGFLVCDAKRIWDFIGDNPATIFEQEPMRSLARAGELVAFEHQGFWQPIDTFREYSLLNDLWSADKAPWRVWDRSK